MKNIKKNTKMTIHSLIWAGTMLLGAFLLKEHEENSTLMIFMMGAWYISHHLFLNKSSKACCMNTSNVLNHKEED